MKNPRFSFLAFTVIFLRNDCTGECPQGNAWVGICPEIVMTAVEDFFKFFFSCFFFKCIATHDVNKLLPEMKPLST